uniref:Uncharacterized protein n=1 Tax=Phanerochaete carnosa TaxID=231932 RepID=A0A895KWW1_9APHY|nr:hypothetical protein K8K84_mgp054 [Phanerochaete carnosa]QRZ60398.1 hypothetical protein [Phanerochaete carnosa]
MVEGTTTTPTNASTTTTTIIQNDGSWGNAVRTIFIYGTGAFRLSVLKGGGTPGSRAFVIASTLAADSLSKVVNNTINVPSYVRSHSINWTAMWEDFNRGAVKVQVDSETLNQLSEASPNKFIGDESLRDLVQALISGMFDKFKFILEPMQVDYSNEVLANQIYDLSILLFILSILILGLIIVLLFNMFIYINMSKIIDFFDNKFIRWYLVLNKKFITIEIFILGSTILYFMYTLSIGILFIATHPIIIN